MEIRVQDQLVRIWWLAKGQSCVLDICSQGLCTHVVRLKDVAACLYVFFYPACNVRQVDFGPQRFFFLAFISFSFVLSHNNLKEKKLRFTPTPTTILQVKLYWTQFNNSPIKWLFATLQWSRWVRLSCVTAWSPLENLQWKSALLNNLTWPCCLINTCSWILRAANESKVTTLPFVNINYRKRLSCVHLFKGCVLCLCCSGVIVEWVALDSPAYVIARLCS